MKRISDCGNYELKGSGSEFTITQIATRLEGNFVFPVEYEGNEDILATILDPQGQEVDLVFFAHPYYGLRDSKGWLTRYPNTADSYGNKLISREWIEQFLALGGSIDGCGVWGIDPNASWVEAQSPGSIVHLLEMEHAGRWDNIFHDVLCISKAGLVIADDINWASFKALALGVRRITTCVKAGITTNLTVMQLGWMKTSKWEFFVAQNATKYPTSPKSQYYKSSIEYGEFFGVSLKPVHDEYDHDNGHTYFAGFNDNGVTNPIWHKAKRDYQKYSVRTKLHQAANTYVAPVLHSSKVFARVVEIAYLDLNATNRHLSNTARFRQLHGRISRSYTTAGTIQYSGDLLFLQTETSVKNQLLKVRQIGLYKVASATYAVLKGTFDVEYKTVFFAWTGSFQNHVEGASVKEAITKLEGKVRIKGLVMSLNDIRTNANFCFAGTKQFLADRMKHVYNLIKGFSEWDELPEEIANIQWNLASRDVFAGYPEP